LTANIERQEDLSKLSPLTEIGLPVLSRTNLYNNIKVHQLAIVAFYDYNDIASKDIQLFKEFLTAVNQLNAEGHNTFFGYYNDSIDSNMEEKYFLHYHTLPKIKVFFKGEALTYNGGHRTAHIKNFVKRLLRETKTRSMHITSGDQLENLVKTIDLMAVFVGNLEGKNYEQYLEVMKTYSSQVLFTHTSD